MRASKIGQTPSDESAGAIQPASATPPPAFPLSWSHYVRLLSVDKHQARLFYEAEALRGGWTVRQGLRRRQIGTQFYERHASVPQQGGHAHQGTEAHAR